MSARNAFRYVSRRLSSSGKVLSEEEKAAKNVYINLQNQNKLHYSPSINLQTPSPQTSQYPNPRKTMNTIAKQVPTIFHKPNTTIHNPLNNFEQLQQWRGIRVKVRNNNLDQALFIMQKKMQSSGVERLIKREQLAHIKNSEKRVLARKILERKIRSQELARKLKSILIKKVRGKRKYDFHDKEAQDIKAGSRYLLHVINSWFLMHFAGTVLHEGFMKEDVSTEFIFCSYFNLAQQLLLRHHFLALPHMNYTFKNNV